jgi:hypothetical protein
MPWKDNRVELNAKAQSMQIKDPKNRDEEDERDKEKREL